MMKQNILCECPLTSRESQPRLGAVRIMQNGPGGTVVTVVNIFEPESSES